MRALDFLLLLAALAVFFAQLYFAYPVTSDAFEDMRISAYLKNGGNYPIESSAIDSLPYIYPPVFPLALYSFETLTNSNAFFSTTFSSYILSLIIISLVFLILRGAFKDENKAVLGSCAILLLPIVFYRLITPIPETLGLAIFLLCLYFYQQKKFGLLLFLLAIFPFIHSRSFIFTILSLGIASIIRKDLFRTIKASIPGGLVFFAFHLAYPIYATGFENPAILQPTLIDSFPLIAIAIAFTGLISLIIKKTPFDPLIIGTICAFVASSYLLPFPFRHIIFLVLPLAYLTSFALAADKRILAIFSVLVALSLLNSVQMRSTPFDSESQYAMQTLGEFDGRNALSDFKYNYAIPYLSGKKVFVGAFAEGMEDGKQRTIELNAFFHRASGGENNSITTYHSIQANLIRKYGIDLLFLEKANGNQSAFSKSFETKLMESDEYAIFSIKRA